MTRPGQFKVDVLPLARHDLWAAHEHVALGSPEHADRLYDRLIIAIRGLGTFPLRYPLARERRFRTLGIRVMVIGPYRVYYAPFGAAVLVLRVWHTARQPPPGPVI